MRKLMISSRIIFVVLLLISLYTVKKDSMAMNRNGEQFLFGAARVPDGGRMKVNVSNTADFPDDTGDSCKASIMIYDMEGKVVHEAEFSLGPNESNSTEFTPGAEILLRPEVICFGRKDVCKCTSIIDLLLDIEIPNYLNPQRIQIFVPRPTPSPTPRGGG